MTAAPQAMPPNASEQRVDQPMPLLDAVEAVAQFHQKPFSKAAALASLPLENGRLTLPHVEAAFENLGLSARVVAKQPSQVPLIVCPFIVLFEGGDVGLVTGRRGRSGKFMLEMPGHKGGRRISAKQLDQETLDHVVYVSPAVDSFLEDPAKDSRSGGHWLWSTVRRFWGAWTQIVLVALFVNLLALALPLFVMNVYDRVIPYNAIPTLWALATGVVIALGFDFVLRMLRATIIDNAGRRIDMKVSADIYRQVLDAKMSERPASAGDIASTVREFENVRDFFTSASLTSVIDLVFIGLFLTVLWLIVGPLVLVPLAAVPLVLMVTLLIQIPLNSSVKKGLTSSHHRHSVLVESLIGIETVKSTSSEGAFQRRWESAVADTVRATSKTRFWSSLAIFFSTFVQQGVSVIIIVWGVYLIAAGETSVGALIAANILAGRVLAPLGGIAMTLSRMQQSITALSGLNKIMGLSRDHDVTVGRAESILQGRLEFRGANFNYPGSEANALYDLTTRISPGERVGLVGRVGSGKSTIGKLLCGLYEVTDGAILLDDIDIRHRHVADLRKAVGYVGQEPDLFSGSVRENICFNGPVAPELFEKVCFITGISSFVQAHPLGYEMPVGERGRYLSGGQKQALALARTLANMPKILFMDEPTASMDSTTETTLVNNLVRFKSEFKTLIVATHRMSLLELVDRIIVIDGGRIIADGPKNEVMKQLGLDRNSASRQAGGATHGQ